MFRSVFGCGKHLQILWSIIFFVAISMVNMLVTGQGPPQNFGHDQSMLGNISAIASIGVARTPDIAIPLTENHATFPLRVVLSNHRATLGRFAGFGEVATFAGAKDPADNTRWITAHTLATMRTRVFSSHTHIIPRTRLYINTNSTPPGMTWTVVGSQS